MMGRAVAFLLPCALAVAACAPTPADHEPGTIGMHELVFDTDRRVLPVGGRLTFSNTSSRSLHVLVPGKDARPRSQQGTPSFGGASGRRAEVGDRWTTATWTTPGTYWITCTLHPRMNLEVVVSPPKAEPQALSDSSRLLRHLHETLVRP